MDNEFALIQTIIADPENDTPRMVYADLMEETGQWERAEFIRVQIELANRPKINRQRFECKICSNVPDEEGLLEHGRGCYTQSEDGGGSEFIEEAIDEKAEALRRRERELLSEHNRLYPTATNQFIWAMPANAAATPSPLYSDSWECHRGFVEIISCSWADFAVHAGLILTATPLREVTLTSPPQVSIGSPMPGTNYARECDLQIPGPNHHRVSSVIVVRKQIEFLANPLAAMDRIILELLKEKWPRLKFHLPATERYHILHGTGQHQPLGVINARTIGGRVEAQWQVEPDDPTEEAAVARRETPAQAARRLEYSRRRRRPR